MKCGCGSDAWYARAYARAINTMPNFSNSITTHPKKIKEK